MRIHNLLGFLLLAALSFGCKKEAKETTVAFDVVDTWAAVLDVTAPPAGPLTVFLPTTRVYSATADSCRGRKITLDQLQQATLSHATLTLQAPVGQNFDFVRQITWYITSEQGNDRMVLATLPNVPLGATTLTLMPTNTALLSYLRPGQYYLTPQLELRQPGQTVVRMQLQLRFAMQARQL
ncbi:hypothetical protein KBK19_03005 [Microvirga sp. STR05]|uniref:Uncharacterized protein n=1 Tax=Hymenobacter duratus TaxID=2771356 RepID=A0ABR8JDA2_9BACT|nr:hypothetical protein [Hymenobacter duratus]MBD2713997.1 hypothetical protein [Hymenobacter duratus]MBR7948899.1 hypothetical protein [Microvirga sp. STR05]